MVHKIHQKKNKTLARRSKLIGLALGIVVLIAILFSIFFVNERTTLLNLKNQMLIVKDDFNSLNPGWQHKEYCGGYGSDVTRQNLKRCYVVLFNDTSVSSSSYAQFIDLLQKQHRYKLIRPTETIQPRSAASYQGAVRVTNMRNPISSDITCEFADVQYGLNKDKGYYLECSMNTNEFYFERRD